MDEAMRGDQWLSRGWYEGFWALLRFLAFFGVFFRRVYRRFGDHRDFSKQLSQKVSPKSSIRKGTSKGQNLNFYPSTPKTGSRSRFTLYFHFLKNYLKINITNHIPW